MNFLAIVLLAVSVIALWAFVGKVRARQEIAAMRKKLNEYEARLEYKGEISNEIAHDIKNPLTAILCSAEALEIIAAPKLDSDSQKTLHYIREYGEQMLKLVTDFLDVNLAEAGRLRVNPEKISLKESIESVVVLLKSTALNKRVQVRIGDVQDSLTVVFDPKHFKQVIFNLVHNAIKFTPEGGTVTLSAVALDEFHSACVSVVDTGLGIPPDVITTIFDPYNEGARALHQRAKGTGIGLALCKNLMELGGGSIQVRSIVGQGTTFEVLMPLSESALEVVQATDNLTRPLEGQHVLIVDKDRGARETMATLIQALGGIVDTADEIENALQSLMTQTYNAVMIDSKGDDGSGYALAKIIKNDLDAKDTKVILAGDLNENPELAREFGVDVCVPKPITGKQLVQSIL